MKKRIIIGTIVGSVLAFTFLPTSGKTEKNKPQLPEVIIDGTFTGVRGYVASFTVEDNQYPAMKCPEGTLMNVIKNEFDFDLNSFTKHCPKCHSGVFSQRDGETIRRCTYCGEPE